MAQAYRYDVFVSFADTEKAWVEGYLLRALGVPNDRILTRQDYTPGAVIAEEVVRAVEESRYTVLVLSPTFLDDRWAVFGERLATWTSVEGGKGRVVPVIREAVEVPLQLQYIVKLDCTDERQWDAETDRLRTLLERPETKPEGPIKCPYPGMVPFETRDRKWFFGREQLTRTVVDTLADRRYLALVGTSGSGKSSFINAGLLPAIEGDLRFGKASPRVVTFRPGASPIERMAGEIALRSGRNAEAMAAELTDPAGEVRPLLEAIPTPQAGAVGLLIVDQLEEAFAQCKDEKLRARFFELLAGLVDEIPPDWRLILAIRSDFEDDLDLTPLSERVQPVERLKVLSKSELRAAIVEPARSVRVHLEPGLVDALIRDADGQRGPLPLLQQTLVQMWANNLRRRLLIQADYEALGTDGRTGLQEALRIWAETTFAPLREREEVVRQIFVRLIEFGVADRKDTRRQQPRNGLVDSADDAEVDKILERLIERRLITSDHDLVTGTDLVDLAHETLIEAWPRLAGWVDRYEEMELARRRLNGTVTEWEKSGHDSSYTYTGKRLREAEAWAEQWPKELGDRDKAFLAASRAKQGRDQLRNRAMIGGGVIGAVLVVAGLVYVVPRAVARITTGSPLVAFAGGEALIGHDNQGSDRLVAVGSFRLEIHEVSNRQWRACMDAGPCGPTNEPSIADQPENANLPVVFVTADQAKTFCDWLGRRLPTATEWERAARGTDGRQWPWGNEVPAFAEIPGLSGLAEVEVGSQTRSPEGIYHLVGNVDEWVTRDVNGLHVAHAGGSHLGFVVVTDIPQVDPIDMGPASGFRCAVAGN
ncbi:MAG TPA: SUMF1/EgtB/PvdO family nonheme iron enzyme [Candidatus Limnocylindrales bacterium]|nr:SUMF1/EgtB/PvdO family nonheme iron enzyme [Candidatus Limnocylindrales bacterium]